MSERLQRLGTGIPARKTSAPRRQACRDWARRFPGEERSRATPLSGRVGSAVLLMVSAGRGTWGAAATVAGAFVASQLRRTFREDVGTLTNRIPTRPVKSCQ